MFSRLVNSTAWMRLLASFLLGTVSHGWAHPATLHQHESSLDPRERVLLASASGSSLRTTARTSESSETRCRLSLRLVDESTKQPISGLVRVLGPEGIALEIPELVNRGLKLRANSPAKDWYVLAEPSEITVPAGAVRIEAFAGLETEIASLPLELRGKTSLAVTVPLRRIFDARKVGWRSGNPHLHLRGMSRAQADEYLRTIPLGDGLELVFVTHAVRPSADSDYISNGYTRESLAQLSTAKLRFGHGEEHRNNFSAGGEGYGHVLLLDLPRLVHPISIGPGITGAGADFPPLRRGIDEARSLGATVVWCHNGFGFEHVPSWVTGRVHAHNIFDGGTQGTYVQTFYRFLDVGLKVPFSTGTDWFIYDYSRVYVKLDEALSVESWLRALSGGRTFITNGPLLEFEADGRAIGDTVSLPKSGRVGLRARAVGRVDFKGLELVHDGKVIASSPSRRSGGHFAAEIKFPATVEKSGWVAARIPGGALDTDGFAALPPNMAYRATGSGQNEFGETLFAHTSPIYLEVAGRPRFNQKAADELIAAMEKSMQTIQAKARFDEGPQRDEVLGVYREAIDRLRSGRAQGRL